MIKAGIVYDFNKRILPDILMFLYIREYITFFPLKDLFQCSYKFNEQFLSIFLAMIKINFKKYGVYSEHGHFLPLWIS